MIRTGMAATAIVVASLVANIVFWLSLIAGALWLLKKFGVIH